MPNLLEETLEVLRKQGKTLDDVEWIGSKDGHITKSLFMELANIDYHNGFGAQEIAEDLILVGDNWWLERGEYDGSEWWEFKTIPIKPYNRIYPKRLHEGTWTSLSQMGYVDDAWRDEEMSEEIIIQVIEDLDEGLKTGNVVFQIPYDEHTITILKSLLEKQLAMEPIKCKYVEMNDEYYDMCPDCSVDLYTTGFVVNEKESYCGNCGQKLNWD